MAAAEEGGKEGEAVGEEYSLPRKSVRSGNLDKQSLCGKRKKSSPHYLYTNIIGEFVYINKS